VREVLPNYSGQIDHKKRCRSFIQASSSKHQAPSGKQQAIDKRQAV